MLSHFGKAIKDSRWQAAVALILIALSTFITRWYSLGVYELDWDEANRMSIAHSLNHGRTLYVDAWDHHTFLDILCFQQIFRIFTPETAPIAIHLLNIGIVITITMAVYSLIRRFTDSFASALLGACVALYMFPHEYFRSSHGELYHSLTSMVAFALYFFSQRTRWTLMGVGILFLAGFCVKQSALFDIGAFLVIHWLYHRYSGMGKGGQAESATAPARSWMIELGWIGLGAGLVVICSVAYFAVHGSLREAVYATFLDAFIYVTGNGLNHTLSRYASTFKSETAFLLQMHWIILASMAASYLCLFVRQQDRRLRFLGLASFIWVLFVLAGIVSIGRFYHHYFIQLVGPLSMVCAYWVAVVAGRWRGLALAGSVILYAMAISQLKINEFIFKPENKSSDIRSVASFIRANTDHGDTIFCYKNSALCLYFLTERFPPIKTFMESQMLEENKDGPMLLEDGLRRWKTHPPKYIVTGSLEHKIPEIDEIMERDFVACTNIGVFRIFQRMKSEMNDKSQKPVSTNPIVVPN